MQEIEIEVLIGHEGKPFYADFALQVTLDLAGKVRFLGRKKEIKTRSRFMPYFTPVVFS
jgi:hypothetical protein